MTGGPLITDEMRTLLRLSEELEREPTIDGVLQRLVEGTATLLGVGHVSVRLLDATRTLLLTHARAGDPFHHNKTFEFVMGEGLVGWVAKNGAPLCLEDAELDERFAPRPDQTKPIRSFVAVPLLDQGTCIGVLSAADGAANRFGEAHLALLGLVSGVLGPQVRYTRLRRLAAPDMLTGVVPEERLGDVLDAREGVPTIEPLSVAHVDVDGFKKLEARLGKGFGNDLLKSVAETLSNVLRRSDPIVRLGGDDFLAVMPGVSLPTAVKIAERVCRSAESQLIAPRANVDRLTVSVGVVERERGETRAQLLSRASSALDEARRRGGNRVETA